MISITNKGREYISPIGIGSTITITGNTNTTVQINISSPYARQAFYNIEYINNSNKVADLVLKNISSIPLKETRDQITQKISEIKNESVKTEPSFSSLREKWGFVKKILEGTTGSLISSLVVEILKYCLI